ncbi:MAG: tetratricopeptide repeat protein [Anaerolineales bacterium]|nr:tetratricopeptide repeat protein [Anaerolineales bacterium]
MPGREDSFQNAMNEGHSAAWDQKWDQAAAAYQKALDEFPENPKALTSLGLALYQLGQYEEALKTYKQAVQLSSDNPLPLEKIAQLSERLGNLKEAIQAAMQAAELYIKSKEVDKALENWLRVTQLDPDNMTAHSHLALVHERLGHTQPAVSEYLAVASLYQQAGNADKAAEMVGRALRVMPNSAEAKQAKNLLKIGQMLPKPIRRKGGTGPLRMAQVRQLEAPKPAENGLNPVAEARKKALNRMAEVLFELYSESDNSQPPPRSVQAFVRGTDPLSLKQSERAKVLLHLGQAIDAQSNNQDAQAAEELERALEAGYKSTALYYNLGLLRATSNRIESALRYLQHAVKNNDYALGAHLVMAEILHKMGRSRESAIEYMEALRLADALVVAPEQADEIRQLYEPLIEGLSKKGASEDLEKLCDNIKALLLQPNWRSLVAEARQQLPPSRDGAPPLPLAEVMTQTKSSQVIQSINKANQLAQDGFLRSAVDEVFNALQHAPTYLPLHTLIGDLLIQDGRVGDAIAKYTVVAQAYTVRGEATQATNMLRRIIQVAPMDSTARTRLIEQLVAQGHVDETIGEYIQLADIYYRLAELDMARKTYTSALRFTQQAGANRSWSIKILHLMADIDMQHLDWRQALRLFEQIRTLQPEDVAVRKRLIDLNLRLNQPNQAVVELDSYVAYLESNAQRAEAIPFLESLAQDNPGQAILQRYLAEEYSRAGRIAEAIAQLDALGENLLNSGDRAGAIRTVETIMALNPPNPGGYKQLLDKLRPANVQP